MKQKKFKTLFSLLTIFFLNLQGFALTPTQNLALIENHIFGYENQKLQDSERLNKIEKFVYGFPKKSTTKERLAKLNTDLGLDINATAKNYSNNPTNNASYEDYSNEPTDPSAQYPIVDNMEEILLKQTYKTENIYKRLDRLEKKAYGKISQGSLSDRVEKLSALVKPISPKQTKETFDDYMANNDEYNYYSPTTKGNPRASSGQIHIQESQLNPNTSATLLSLEKNLLGKSYPTDTTNERLSRLEKKILHKEFTSEPNELRLERLATIANAQQTSQVYKENKLMQHLSTGVQIGGMILMILAMIL